MNKFDPEISVLIACPVLPRKVKENESLEDLLPFCAFIASDLIPIIPLFEIKSSESNAAEPNDASAADFVICAFLAANIISVLFKIEIVLKPKPVVIPILPEIPLKVRT